MNPDIRDEELDEDYYASLVPSRYSEFTKEQESFERFGGSEEWG
jgi:hypothetical protein